MEGVPKVSDMEIDDFIPEEPIPKVSPVNLPQPSDCNKISDTETEEEPCDHISSEVSKLEQDDEINEVDTNQVVEQ
ncbi:6265_t:CDS:2, partial [Racocetra persica]